MINGKGIVLLSEDIRTQIVSVNNEMATNGLRVLAITFKELEGDNIGSSHHYFSEETAEMDLTFLGLIAMMDPRLGATEAVKQCKNAGIDVIMITGDHKLTATAVAREVGILVPTTTHNMQAKG